MNGLPKGAVIMWYGEVKDIPDGWVICNGENDTPDLRDKFIVGAGNSYALKATGGAAEVALNVNQMPKHNHNVNLKKEADGDNPDGRYSGDLLALSPKTYNQFVWMESEIASKNKSVYDRKGDTKAYRINDYINQDDIGGGNSHENLPPYYALYFIMKII